MSLEDKVKKAIGDFDGTAPDDILDLLRQIQPKLSSSLTSEYLQGKIDKASDVADGAEKKKQCKSLMPYLDWYVQGL